MEIGGKFKELKLFEVLDLNMDPHLHECFWDGLRINYCEILCEFTMYKSVFLQYHCEHDESL